MRQKRRAGAKPGPKPRRHHIQIRNVPEELHQLIKARAALDGRTMSDFILAILRRAANTPTRRQMLERLDAIVQSDIENPTIAESLRVERDAR
jgi:plasmid stability protein